MPEAPAGPRFVAADSADAALTTLHVILPPNFASAWQKGQIMIVVEAEVSRNRTLVSALSKKNTFAVDDADRVLIESLRAVPAIFERGMAILSRDAFLRLLPALQNHPRVTFGKATRATISSASLRPELLVESRGEGGIAGEPNLPPNAQDQFVFRDPQNVDRVLMRNLDAENAAVARLEQIGFARTDAGGFVLHGQPSVVRFFATDYQRLQRDWKITLTAQVEKWTGQIERVTPKLEIVGSGQDWFEVRYSLTTPGGEVFSNADIQRLLRSGQSQTRLKNGHLAVIDTSRLEDFQHLIPDSDPPQTHPSLYH